MAETMADYNQLTDKKVIIELTRKFGGNNGGLTVEIITNQVHTNEPLPFPTLPDELLGCNL